MSYKGSDDLSDITDILIVQKIKEKDLSDETYGTDGITATQCLCFESGCDCERDLFIEEQEAIIKKQLQMLQADERGKQALISEIAALKQKQEHKAKVQRSRQQVLATEKERAKKIASLPPPLPNSVKLLLKKNDEESKNNKPDVQMPNELTAVTIKPAEASDKNKENLIIDPEELEQRQKLLEERQIKAKKRFNEALKKDRQKEEYSSIMKQIQNAELLNRREMAKNISSDKKGMPCPLSDKFQTARKQADMEEATEKLFKKTGTKEHVIEDIEGYQDHYEQKYKQIDSSFEVKMIDCVPSFVKENYEYLLEDDSKFTGGKNFCGLDESSGDMLNEAYIESPGADERDGREKIDLAISHLDKVRSSLEVEIEETLKPLLVAAVDVPKKESKDKAVETESIRVTAEDKAVETDKLLHTELLSPPPTAVFDYKRAGVMAYKRRPHRPAQSHFQGKSVPDMCRRDVHYLMPPTVQSEDAAGSWSSSSYCSLPSKHGMPTVPAGSVECEICVAERNKDSVKSDFRYELSPSTSVEESTQPSISSKNSQLSELVQKLVQKHLAGNSPSNCLSSREKAYSDSSLPLESTPDTAKPAFEKDVIGKSKAGVFVQQHKSEELSPVTGECVVTQKKKIFPSPCLDIDKPMNVAETGSKKISDSDQTEVKTLGILKDVNGKEDLPDDIYMTIKNFKSPKSPEEYSDYDFEAKRIQAIHQVLSRRIPRFTLDSPEQKQDHTEPKVPIPDHNAIPPKTHVYHELSTIQEVDSALTAGSSLLSQSKLSDISNNGNENKSLSKEESKAAVETEKLKIISLLDPPDSQVSELAKSIHFVPEAENRTSPPLQAVELVPSEHLKGLSISPKESSLTPSHASSSDSNSLAFLSSSAKVFSSTLTDGQVNHPHLKDIKVLPNYFKDISEIKKKIESKNSDSHLSGPSDFLSSITVSSSNSSAPSGVDPVIPGSINNLDAPELTKGYVSGYISDLEVPEITETNISQTAQKQGCNIPSTVFGYSSGVKMHEMINTDLCRPHQEQNHTKQSELAKIKEYKVFDSSAGSFKALTPVSNISSPGESAYYKYTLEESKGSFKALTPVSDISSPGESAYYKYELQESKGNFKALTPISNLSSPAESAYNYRYELQESKSTGSFKALTPVSNISSPGDSAYNIHKTESLVSRSTDSFKALTPVSNISSPSESAYNQRYESQNFKSSENPKVLTPHSSTSSVKSTYNVHKYKQPDIRNTEGSKTPHSVSSASDELACSCTKNIQPSSTSNSESLKSSMPSSSSSHSTEIRREISFERSEFHPVILRLDIATSSLSSECNKSFGMKKNPLLHCNLALKTHLSDSAKSSPASKVQSSGIIPGKTSDEPKIDAQTFQKVWHSTEAKIRAYTCSSDFFIPSLNDDTDKKNDEDQVTNTLNSDLNTKIHPSKIHHGTEMIDVNKKNQKNSPQLSDTNSYVEVLKKPADEKFEKSNGKKNVREYDKRMNFNREPPSNLQTGSSTSSSSENLSVISGSKVVGQSTPIKSWSALIQEPGILDEPDLTLITTKLSNALDATGITRDLFPSVSSKQAEDLDKTCMVQSPSTDCETPASEKTQFLASPDTPSMLSFLHHEISCQQTEKDDVFSPVEGGSVVPDLSEKNAAEKKDVKRSLFQRTDYKTRTKRLWNNLEEVKKKNLQEEKKREMEINRKKAKEFSKKFTPKKKGK